MSRTACVTYNDPKRLRVSASPRESRPTAVGRRAFTLVEMLVVVAIIGILASTLLGALFVATEHARAERTRSLISKLHNQMMQRWEEYETRRVPLMAISTTATPDQIATDQLVFLREIMRMELPDTYEDLQFSLVDGALTEYGFAPQAMIVGTQPPNYLPSLTRAYQQRVLSVVDPLIPGTYPDRFAALNTLDTENQSAEMLYLIMTTASGDEDSGGIHFSAKDEGDTDGDGMPEFLDAWGNPIEWIRWPAGFANFDTLETTAAVLPSNWGLVTDFISADAIDDPDPFNPRRVAVPRLLDPDPPSGVTFATGFPRVDYRIIPLIVSPGPDGEYGLAFRRGYRNPGDTAKEGQARTQNSDPFFYWETTDSGGTPLGVLNRRGMPIQIDLTTGKSFDGTNATTIEWVHLDNITNHLTEAE